jgi:hypothetical protein
MASAKQIAWRKKFARMVKAGKFRKKKSSTYKKRSIKFAKKGKLSRGGREPPPDFYD